MNSTKLYVNFSFEVSKERAWSPFQRSTAYLAGFQHKEEHLDFNVTRIVI